MAKKVTVEVVFNASKQCQVQLVVLTHNHSDVTKDFLELLYANTPERLFHLIVVDNNSADDTRDLLESTLSSKDNATLAFCPINSGVIGGRNIGCRLAMERQPESELVMFLDNDQYVMYGWLEHHLAVLEHGYDVVGVEAWQMNRSLMPSKKIVGIHEPFNYVGCGGMIIHKRVIQAVGVLDERYNPAYFEDPDFCIRVYDAGFKIGWNAKARILHLGHKTLGADQVEKQRRFFDSWQRFRAKWGRRTLPQLTQCFLSEFKGENTS